MFQGTITFSQARGVYATRWKSDRLHKIIQRKAAPLAAMAWRK
jgi:hypothetical protein